MFEVGFWEMALCAAIALVVLGPEKLPAIARTLGRWTGQARVYVRNLSAELDRELKTKELKEQLQRTQRALQDQASAAKQSLTQLTKPDEPQR